MKKYFYIIIAAVATICSCSTDLLDLQNKNTLSTGVFWKTEDDAESGVVSVYNMFYRQGTWTRNIYTQMNGMADDGVSFAGWTELAESAKFIFNNYNFSEVNLKLWREHWTAIYRANQCLDNIPSIPFSDESHKQDLLAQVKFLRSFYYFYMCVLWDNIPLVLQTSSAADKPATCTPDQVFTQIEADLTEAIEYLPLTREEPDYGRPTKGSAYGLLAKVYAQHHKWQEAKECLEWIVDGEGAGLYDLVDDYGDNFNNRTEDNKESLYEIHFSLTHYVGFDQTDNPFDPAAQLGTQIEVNQSPKGTGWNNIEARHSLVDIYKREKTVTNENDIRLYYTLWYSDAETDFPGKDHIIYGKTWKEGWSDCGNRAFIKKYSTDVKPLYYWNDNNFRSIRLADMLLLYAETLNELEGPSAKAVACVDRVRARVNLPGLKDSKYYNGALVTSDKDAFREQIKIERGLELALECVRWIDLKRWGLDDEKTISDLRKVDADFDNFVIGKSSRMPIPQIEIDNNPNLVQNPNY